MPFVGHKLLAIYGVSPEAFFRKYNIEPCVSTCDDCGREKIANIPARGPNGYVGLLSAPCPCGSKSIAPYSVLLGRGLSPEGQAK